MNNTNADKISLENEVSNLTFDNAKEKFKNLIIRSDEDYFDLNYKHIAASIYKTADNKCRVGGTIDVYDDYIHC